MKKTIYCVFVLIFIVGLFGCKKKDNEVNSTESNKVTVTQAATQAPTKAETQPTQLPTATQTPGATQAPAAAGALLTPEEDAFIIFSYSYSDGKKLDQEGVTADTILRSVNDNIITYSYTEHILSCGTHMNGTITEETNGDEIIVKGSFAVTNNKYKINELKIDYTFNKKSKKYDGILTLNGNDMDINTYNKHLINK